MDPERAVEYRERRRQRWRQCVADGDSADRNTHVASADCDSHLDTDRDSDDYADGDRRSHLDTNGHSHAYTDRDAHGHADCESDLDTDGDCDRHADTDRHTHVASADSDSTNRPHGLLHVQLQRP